MASVCFNTKIVAVTEIKTIVFGRKNHEKSAGGHVAVLDISCDGFKHIIATSLWEE